MSEIHSRPGSEPALGERCGHRRDEIPDWIWSREEKKFHHWPKIFVGSVTGPDARNSGIATPRAIAGMIATERYTRGASMKPSCPRRVRTWRVFGTFDERGSLDVGLCCPGPLHAIRMAYRAVPGGPVHDSRIGRGMDGLLS